MYPFAIHRSLHTTRNNNKTETQRKCRKNNVTEISVQIQYLVFWLNAYAPTLAVYLNVFTSSGFYWEKIGTVQAFLQHAQQQHEW